MDTKSVSQALVTCFFALGCAVGEDKLLEARKHLRAAVNDGAVDRGTARILQSIIAGIDCQPGAAASRLTPHEYERIEAPQSRAPAMS